MAKKKVATTDVVEEQVIEQAVQAVTSPPMVEKAKPTKPSWEIKDRYYYLLNGLSPLTLRLQAKGIFYFDEEKGYEREMMFTRNQKTPFVDEMVGVKQPGQIVFRNGVLMVPKNLQILQKLLSIYHPDNGRLFRERDDEATAAHQVDNIETQLAAMNKAVSLDIDMAEAIMRAEIGSKVSSMSSKELKRDLLVFASSNPELFLDLAEDDNVYLRNIGIRATELDIIRLSGDNRTFTWSSNNRKLMTIPFDEHPYSALAAWFKTDEGMEVLNSIEKRLN